MRNSRSICIIWLIELFADLQFLELILLYGVTTEEIKIYFITTYILDFAITLQLLCNWLKH